MGIYAITKGLKENGAIIDLLAINTPKHAQPLGAMAEYANQIDVFVDTRISPVKLLINLIFKTIPYNVERFYDKKVSQKLIELLQANSYDFIQVEGAFVAKYIEVIRQHSNRPVIIRAHNIEYIIWERLAVNTINPLKKWFYNHLSKKLKAFENKYYNLASGIAAITEEDKQRLLDMGITKPIKVIPAGVILDKYLQADLFTEKPNTIFSISALDWAPNIEGLKWFLENVWNEMLKQHPELTLHIAGKSTPDWVLKLQLKNVFIHGFVEDAIAFKKSHQIMLVPLLSGGGMRVKIIEGMAAKKCIISSTIGAEGINYTPNKNIVIADTPAEWITAITHCLQNNDFRESIAAAAFDLVGNQYENKAITQKYIDFYLTIK
jgi:glycosyltransferase involved in cell wall biosynthesis